jgi:hypothetical protein
MMDQRRAIQIYLENRDKFQGVPQSDAVNLIRRSGGLPAAAVAPAETAPTAIPVAAPAAPVAAALAAAAPPPVPMAAPAPVVEDEPAPAPVAEYVGPNQAALRAYNLANPEAPASAPAAKNAPVDYGAMARNAAAQKVGENLRISAEIERTATIDPEIQELLSNRSKRYETELSNVDKDRKQATWMAVAQAGMKMAQSQSPYFMQALASGMEAGLEGFSEAKAKAAEKKARLQDAKEDLVLKAKELRDQAVREGIAARVAAKQAAAADVTLESGSLANIIGQKTAAEQIRAPGLENAYKQAVISKVYSDMATDKARLALSQRTATSGGGGALKTSDVKAAIAGAASDNRLIDNRLENFIDPPSAAEKKQLLARRNQNNETIRQGNSILSGKIGVSNNNPLGLNLSGR